MEKFTVHTGLVVPLDRANVDTDAIIPKQFLKSIKRTGFGENLFDAWRFLDVGEPGKDPRTRKPNPDFVLNYPQYQGATILLARKNFGCGSSREHAPQALRRWGIRAVVAESYAEIFFGNSGMIGLPCAIATHDDIERLMSAAEQTPSLEWTLDIRGGTVTGGGLTVPVTVPASARDSFLTGHWDGTGLLLADYDAVERTAAKLPYVAGF